MAKKNISRYECLPLSVRDVINNALMKDSIAALSFDSKSKHKYVVPKFMIPMVIEIMDDIWSERINPEDYIKYGVEGTVLPS